MTTLDERIARHRELSQQREEVDHELARLSDDLRTELTSLLGGLSDTKPSKGSTKPKSRRKCGTCGVEGHSAKTCPTLQGSSGVPSS